MNKLNIYIWYIVKKIYFYLKLLQLKSKKENLKKNNIYDYQWIDFQKKEKILCKYQK